MDSDESDIGTSLIVPMAVIQHGWADLFRVGIHPDGNDAGCKGNY
jgi:hypothetical protein